MGYALFLDDQRGCPTGWVLASGYEEFVRIIKEKGKPEMIAFDHDLGDGENPPPPGTQPMTGYDCAKWLVENDMVPTWFSVHSYNYHGGTRIKLLMLENGSKYQASPNPYKNTV